MTTFTNLAKSGELTDAFILEIGDNFDLLIDSTYKLEIQSESSGIVWNNETKS